MKTTHQTKDRRGRILRTAEDRRKLIKRQRSSGLRMAEFCRQNGIHPATFSGWLSVRRQGPRTGKHSQARRRPRFAQVQVPMGVAAPIEIDLPQGIRLRVRDAGVLAEITGFIREMTGREASGC